MESQDVILLSARLMDGLQLRLPCGLSCIPFSRFRSEPWLLRPNGSQPRIAHLWQREHHQSGHPKRRHSLHRNRRPHHQLRNPLRNRLLAGGNHASSHHQSRPVRITPGQVQPDFSIQLHRFPQHQQQRCIRRNHHSSTLEFRRLSRLQRRVEPGRANQFHRSGNWLWYTSCAWRKHHLPVPSAPLPRPPQHTPT